jgi:ATP-dependent DNA helicase Rep
VLNARAVGSLQEFGRYVNDLEFRARHTMGAEDAKAFLLDWLKDIGYEKHLYDGEDNEKVAASRWTNVLEFCDWMAKRCGGEIDDTAGVSDRQREEEPAGSGADHRAAVDHQRAREGPERGDAVDAARGQGPGVAARGAGRLRRRHAAVQAGRCGRRPWPVSEAFAQRLQEERRLMYVGITRAQRSLAVSWSKKRKKGRETMAAQPSRFIAEMALDQDDHKEDPREKLKALRAEFAKKSAESAAAAAAAANAP